MMFSNIEDYERRINELNYQISELQNQVNQLQILIKEKDDQINQLYNENLQLKAQMENVYQEPTQSPYYSQQQTQSSQSPQSENYQQQPTQSPYYGQQATQDPVIRQTENPIVTTSANTSFHKRECPKCGAFGFAIKEVDDKSRLLSYVSRRIYAKKRVCTKCFYEF